jgi:hypothetical protein
MIIGKDGDGEEHLIPNVQLQSISRFLSEHMNASWGDMLLGPPWMKIGDLKSDERRKHMMC